VFVKEMAMTMGLQESGDKTVQVGWPGNPQVNLP